MIELRGMENTTEKREAFIRDFHALTPEEHMLIGSSEGIPPGESSINFLKKAETGDEEAVRLLRTPIHIQQGTGNTQEINCIRTGGTLRGSAFMIFSLEYQVRLSMKGIEMDVTPKQIDEKTGMASGEWEVRLARGVTGEFVGGEMLESLPLEPEFELFYSLGPVVGDHRVLRSRF